MDRRSQLASILYHLQSGRNINPLEALDLCGCFRLQARIFDLKQQGYVIKTNMVKDPNGKRFASYELIGGLKYKIESNGQARFA